MWSEERIIFLYFENSMGDFAAVQLNKIISMIPNYDNKYPDIKSWISTDNGETLSCSETVETLLNRISFM